MLHDSAAPAGFRRSLGLVQSCRRHAVSRDGCKYSNRNRSNALKCPDLSRWVYTVEYILYNVFVIHLKSSDVLALRLGLLHHLAGLLHKAGLITWVALELPGAIDDLIVTSVLQPLQLPPHVAHDLCKLLEVDVLLRAHQIPPDSSCQHGIALHEALIVGEEDGAPLREHILEVLLTKGVRIELVPNNKPVFGGVEGMIRQVLDPCAGMCFWQHPKAHLQHVHVDKGDLRPVGESGLQAESCTLLARYRQGGAAAFARVLG